jgi:hypothetical protein
MAGATQVTINISLSIGLAALGTVGLSIDGGTPLTQSVLVGITGVSVTFDVDISPGSHTFTVTLSGITVVIGTPTFQLQFNDVPPTTSPVIDMTVIDSVLTGSVTLTLACIHGSSLIVTKNGLKRIDQLNINDEVLSGDHLDEYAKIKAIAQCWIQHPGPSHDAIIFEPNSLANNEPSQRLIIDPGHPVSTQKEYLENGFESLRPAGSYLEDDNVNNTNIYVKKWTDPIIQEQPSVRFDLVLDEPYKIYVANGIVVRCAGYKGHYYKDLI